MLQKFSIGFFTVVLFALAGNAQQINQSLSKSSRVFSAGSIKSAQQKIDIFNKIGGTKFILRISVFKLPAIEKSIFFDSQQTAESEKSFGKFVKKLVDQNAAAKNEALFKSLVSKNNTAVKNGFEKLKSRHNTIIVSISLGMAYATQRAREIEEFHTYYDFAIYKGKDANDDVFQDLESILTGFREKDSQKFDLDPMEVSRNDKNLGTISSVLFSAYTMPVTITWEDLQSDFDNSWDNNSHGYAQSYVSFQTSPFNGIAWKCIPADNSFVGIGVSFTSGEYDRNGASRLQFRLTNTNDFKLKSNTPENNMLWIASSGENKETAIVPVVDGKDLDIYRINVVAYDKIIKTVSVVYVDEENDDIQRVKAGTTGLSPTDTIVDSGSNNFFESKVNDATIMRVPEPQKDDEIIIDPKIGKVVLAGPNGVAQTFANNTNIEPVDLGLDLDALEKKLNEVYGPCLVEWKVEKSILKKAINYDMNNNGYLDPSIPTRDPVTGKMLLLEEEEEKAIYTQARIGSSDHHLFFVKGNLNQRTQLLGRATEFQSAFIFTENILLYEMLHPKNKTSPETLASRATNELYFVCTHELGHASLKLDHTIESDDLNLMHPFNDNWKLRKFQWDIIHGKTD
jgi:hypothetical protein